MVVEHIGLSYPMRFGLSYDPFLKNHKECFVETDDAREALHRLNLLADTKGFGLLTGEPGTGKTTVIRNWCRSLNPSLFKVVYSSLSTLTVIEFYRNIALGLGLQPAFRKVDNFHLIQDEITRLWSERRITPVFVVDEANHICSDIFSDFKILFNFEMDSQDRSVVLIAGLPQIFHTLRLSSQEALRQRIVLNCSIDGINKAEGRTYIEAHLRHAGATHPVFEENAIEALLNRANGVPRVLNSLCSRSLIIADRRGKSAVDADTALAAIDDCELS